MIHAQVELENKGKKGARSDERPGFSPLREGKNAAASLTDEWEFLQVHGTWPTQGHGCIMAMSRMLMAQKPVRIVLAQAGSSIGGLLPLCRDDGFFSRWRLMGNRELGEPSDAIYDGAGSARQLASALARDSRPLCFDRISADSLLVAELQAAMKGRGLLAIRPADPSPTIPLGEQWREPESCFNAGRRSDFRRARRKADGLGQVTFEMLSPGVEEFDALFDEAVNVEFLGWKGERGNAIAGDRRMEDFFRGYFRDACARDQFRVAFMRIDGKAVATQLALEWGCHYWLFKIGHNADYNKCSPGTLLMLHTLGWAANRGLRGYEFLGIIEGWITKLWTQEMRECVQVRTYPFNLRGAVALMADGAVWLRHRLPWKRP